MLRAVILEMLRNFGPAWGASCNIGIADSEAARLPGMSLARIILNPDLPGANAEHSYDVHGPTITAAINAFFSSWPVTLSHEVWEWLVNPYLNRFRRDVTTGTWYPEEITDPVNNYWVDVEVDDDSIVRLHAYTLPAFWIPNGHLLPSLGPLDNAGPGRTALCPASFHPAPGCSMIATKDGITEYTVYN